MVDLLHLVNRVFFPMKAAGEHDSRRRRRYPLTAVCLSHSPPNSSQAGQGTNELTQPVDVSFNAGAREDRDQGGLDGGQPHRHIAEVKRAALRIQSPSLMHTGRWQCISSCGCSCG